ncbi:MAG: hypothetical protein WCL02_03990 [bacterium]
MSTILESAQQTTGNQSLSDKNKITVDIPKNTIFIKKSDDKPYL